MEVSVFLCWLSGINTECLQPGISVSSSIMNYNTEVPPVTPVISWIPLHTHMAWISWERNYGWSPTAKSSIFGLQILTDTRVTAIAIRKIRQSSSAPFTCRSETRNRESGIPSCSYVLVKHIKLLSWATSLCVLPSSTPYLLRVLLLNSSGMFNSRCKVTSGWATRKFIQLLHSTPAEEQRNVHRTKTGEKTFLTSMVIKGRTH